MSDRTLQAQITAVDKASPVFRQVASGAEKMGQSIDQSAQKAGRSTEDLNKRMAALGAGLTAGAALLGQWSRSAQDAEAIQRQLEASIAATGESFDDYAAQIQEVGERAVQLGQDDEAAMQAISALTQITGSAAVAINEMGLVMDLAAAKSISLESAAELVGKVHEGNTGILQRYGIAVEEGATAEEALAQIQQQVAGQAEAHATTYARLREELSNVTDAIGGAVGEFAPLLALLPGVSSGFTLVGSAVGALAPNLTKAAVASKALSLAMGPAGLVVAAGAAAVAIYKVIKSLDEANMSASEAEEQIANFDDAIAKLGKAGASSATLSGLGALRQVLEEIALASEQAQNNVGLANAAILKAADEQREASARGDSAGALAAQDRLEAARDYEKQLQSIIVKEDEFKDLQENLVDIFTDMNPLNADLVIQRLNELVESLKAGGISADEFVDAVAELNDTSDTYGLTIAEIVANSRAHVAASGQVVITTKQTESAAKASAARWNEYDAAVRAATQADIDKAKANQELLASMSVQANAEADQLERNTQKWTEYDEAQRKANDSRVQSSQGAQEYLDQLALEREEAAKVAAGAATMGDAFDGVGSDADGMAAKLDAANQALKDNRTALDQVAAGTSKASYQLAAFKEVQDGLLTTQGVYNQQISEYDQNLNNIDKALEVVNRHKEEGLELSEDEIFILDNAAEAQDRLTAGVDDATIAQGKAAVEYGKNMTIGDKLNATLGGLDETTGDLTQAINDLVLALNGVPEDVETTISANGLDDAVTDAAALRDLLANLDGTNVTTNINNVIKTIHEDVTVGGGGAVGPGGGMRDGGIVPHEEARLGLVTRGLRAVTVGEAGPETVLLPAGSRVRNAAATAASEFTRGVVLNVHIGVVNGIADLEDAFDQMTRMVRARFAGLGM